MLFFRRLPPTHARALWALVIAAAAFLAAGTWYAFHRVGLASGRPNRDETVVQPVRNQPSLIGRVTAIDGATLRVESKQAFAQVDMLPAARITKVGGDVVDRESLTVGVTIAATGRDLGDGRLSAEAIVVLTGP